MEMKFSPPLSPFQATYLSAAVAATVEVLPGAMSPNCCIGATRLLREVCRDWMKVSPCSVLLQVWNPSMTENFERHARGETVTDSDMKRAYYLYCDGQNCDVEGNWPGHLVGLVEGAVLVDLTLPQCNRPAKGIDLTPLVGVVPPEWGAGDSWADSYLAGCRLRYQCRPQDQSWQAAPDWNYPQAYRRLYRLVRDRLQDLEITPNTRRKQWKKT